MTQRILVINFGGIGDEILFLPVLESIKKAIPDSHITLLLEPRSKAVKEICNLIDEIKLFDIKKQPLLPWDYLQLCHILQSGNYQTVISSGGSPLVSCLLFASGIKQRIGYDSGNLSRLLLTKVVKLNKDQYAGNMYHDLVQGLGITAGPVVPKIKAPTANISAMQNLLNFHYGNESTESLSENNTSSRFKILIHPGISQMAIRKGIIKTWPAANWAALINKLLQNPKFQVILAGGPDDEDTIKEINQALKENLLTVPEQNSFVSVFGLTKSLADLAALINISNMLICVDSAPMHLGVALNKPLLAIFGPTNPECLLPPSPNFKFIKMADFEKKADEIQAILDSVQTEFSGVKRGEEPCAAEHR